MHANTITTRFAPSPTGYLHAGGARTALFNWAFARRHGGKFILRLEDTDRKRSTDQAASQIFEDLRWLGLEWDEGPNPKLDDPKSNYLNTQVGENGPYCQSQRLEIYDRFIKRLLDMGRAYESDESDREAATDCSGTVVRFKTSGDAITVHDEILGNVTVQPGDLEDFVIRKSDGFATYHLAVVVDDHLMGVTHVFRAQEHLSNTTKHWALQEALGFEHPVYAHFPLIFNPDGKKMSKREKPRTARAAAIKWTNTNGTAEDLAHTSGVPHDLLVSFLDAMTDHIPTAEAIAVALGVKLPEIDVHDFRRSGYLPEVLCNYLSLLGWSPGNDLEIFDKQFLAEHFDIARVGKSAARFDRTKLLRFNANALRALSPERFQHVLREYGLEFFSECIVNLPPERFPAFCRAYQNRSQTLADPFILGSFLFLRNDQIDHQPEVLKECILADEGAGRRLLEFLLRSLTTRRCDQAHEVDDLLSELCESTSISVSVASQAIRVALTGGKVSPGIGDTCEMLGQESVVARIQGCLSRSEK